MSEADGIAKKSDPDVATQLDGNFPSSPEPEATLNSGAPAATGAASSTAPKSIGPYQLIRKLGEGGMGQVWLAEQTAPVQRKVALKLIKVGMYDENVLRRFQSERQSLAMMDHPCIAKIFDAGATPDGQPYFVMEYVPGVPITDYCDEKRLTIKDRLELFIKVCEGVQHAHQKAIIHRDLKPANILVAEVDGKPVPRIIDFGLAKATTPELGGETMFTRVGAFVGTPGYMSPEQADPSLQDIDTRTDVYSLGAVLYVLLTGVEPFDTSQWQKRPLYELIRELREVEPPSPSTKVRTDKQSSATSAELRGVQPRQLQTTLHGDLDWITMKALEKDRARRYGTLTELAADINRYLTNQPVLARPASAAYRLQKYVRRHRLAAGFAAAIAVLLVAFAATMAVQAVRIARERDLANRNAEIAEKNRSEATKQAQLALDTIYQVVTDTEGKLSPIAGTGALRKELLESAMKNLDKISRTAATSTWADRTTGVALQRMAEFYDQMGMTSQETEVQRRSLQIFNRLMKEEPTQDWNPFDAAISYDGLGKIGRETEPEPSKIYGYYEQSRQLAEQLVKTVHQAQPTQIQRYRKVATSYIKLSALALELHDPAKALGYAQYAQAWSLKLAKATGSETNDISESYYSLGRARLLMGQEALAREAYSRAELLQRESVQSDPLNAPARQTLGRTNLAMGDMELELGNTAAGLEWYRKAEAIFVGLIGKDKNNAELQWYLANTQYAIGNALRTSGERDEAEAYFRRCLATREVLFRATPNNIQRRIELMLVNAQLGKTEDALGDARVVEQYAPRNPGKLFSAACAYALSARAANTRATRDAYVDEAIRLLRMAIASGFRDKWVLQRDPELESIRSVSAYQQLLNTTHTGLLTHGGRSPTPTLA